MWNAEDNVECGMLNVEWAAPGYLRDWDFRVFRDLKDFRDFKDLKRNFGMGWDEMQLSGELTYF